MITVSHKFVSPKSEQTDPTIVGPSEWNANHAIVDNNTTKKSIDYNFSAITPTGSPALTQNISNTITLPNVPLGLNGTDVGHYIYISGGTGTAEAVLITGGTATSGGTNQTITFTPLNNHSGVYTLISATSGIQEAIVTLGQPGLVDVQNGALNIYGPITVPAAGYRIIGAGERATILNIAASFPLTVNGVFILLFATFGLNIASFAQLEQMTVKFIQPDSTNIALYTHWPSAVYSQSGAYFRLYHFDTDLAWTSIDARSNGTGSTIADCTLSGFGHMMLVDTFGDTVRLSNVHNIAGWSATANQVSAFSSNSVGIFNAGAPLLISNFLSLANIQLIATAGITQVSNSGFDSNDGLQISGGVVLISNSYFTQVANDYAIQQTGGNLFITNCLFESTASSATNQITVTNANGGIVICSIVNSFFNNALFDITDISVSASFGAVQLILHDNIFEHAPPTLPMVLCGAGSWVSVVDNICSPSSTIFLSITTSPSAGGSDRISGNSRNGTIISLPASPIGIYIDKEISSYGAVIASATTIAPTASQFHVSGTTPIVNITVPPGLIMGSITLIPDGIFTTTSAGNIAIASTAVVGKALIMTYDLVTTKWYPSY